MTENTAKKRRKIYLDGDGYFDVPSSTLYRHEKAHAVAIASATSRAQSTSVGPSAQSGNAAEASPNTSQGGSNDGDDNDISLDHNSSDSFIIDGGEEPDSGDERDDMNSARSANDTCESGDSSDSSDEYDASNFSDGDSTLPSWFSQYGGEKLPNSNVTKAAAIAAVMSFAVSQGLTWTALGDLAKLINFIVGTNVLPQSKFTFRKLWARDMQDVVQHHFYCEPCKRVMATHGNSAECNSCHSVRTTQSLKNEGSFFFILNLATQLSLMIERTKEELHESLEALKQPSTTISDITKGQCYSRLREEQNLRPDDLTLTINTDGSPVWKSSKTSVWPLQFIVNELPPHLRFKHPVLAGLWFGRKHPEMQLFLEEFVNEVNSTGVVKWTHKGNIYVSKPYVLCFSVDAPARASVQNMVTFNGYFGCTWCLNPGEHREGSMRYTMVSPMEQRTSDRVKSEMHLASRLKDTINGLKGPSALMNLKGR
ncbi:hypothetical protein HPB49_004611 [Dermacentor silvarum]|uniref:Uncharacterized protein n=1 Tax=Dermacentor silvarum TaxID=543639 RepID=A0ACB8DUS5_DERSI|nr:hypothetical protein HPB49_004611 [Dermacentor silvarum]